MGTIRFEIRKDKCDKNGKAPIRLVYQLKQVKRYFNTGKSVLPYCWNVKEQRAVSLDKDAKKKAREETPNIPDHLFLNSKEAEQLNHLLKGFTVKVTDIEEWYRLNEKTYGCEDVVNELKQRLQPKTKRDESSDLLYSFIDQYIQEHASIREERSLQVYRSLKRHLQDFQRHTGQKITFAKLDYSFFQSFQTFLVTGAGLTKNKKGELVRRTPLNNTTAAKQLSTIKTFLGYARKSGVEISEKYKDFKIKREQMEVIALTNDEFIKLFSFDLSANKKLAQVRDVFCFGCTTGLRYSDLAQLKREHIKQEEIKITITKTKQHLTIPLTPYSRVILERYADRARPLPVISNQKMNEYVKELCKLVGIDEQIEIVRFHGSKKVVSVYPKYDLIGSHTGRKTFATLSLEKGMSAEQVMAIGGWKDYKSFKRYVNVTDQLKKTVMLKAWDADMSELKLKAV